MRDEWQAPRSGESKSHSRKQILGSLPQLGVSYGPDGQRHGDGSRNARTVSSAKTHLQRMKQTTIHTGVLCADARRKAFGIDPVELGSRHAWTSILSALDDDDKLMAVGMWIYVTYRCFNHQRTHASSWQHEDMDRALNQWMKDAPKNTPLVGRFLKQLWPNDNPGRDDASFCPRAKKRRRKVAAT